MAKAFSINQTVTELEKNITLSEDVDGILSEAMYEQSNEDPSFKSVTTPSGAVALVLGVSSAGSADTNGGREEALLNRSSVLFVAVSFILLMVISLAWLVFYYVQRFRYIHSKEQVSRRLAELARKAVARIPVKTLHADDKETNSDINQCAICIEPFRPLDIIRILPCRHYFHKLCIDPWLLEQRSCPMCKLDILQAYGLRTDFCAYPVTPESGPGTAVISDSAVLSSPSGAAGASLLGLPSGSEEEDLERVSLLVHHSNTAEAELVDPTASPVTSPTTLDLKRKQSGVNPAETKTASSDWWSVVSDGDPRSSTMSPLAHLSNTMSDSATVSLSDHHLAPTGLLLANTNSSTATAGHQIQAPTAALALTSTIVSGALPKPRHLCDRDEVPLSGHHISEFYHIDDPKTEDVTVTGACSGSSNLPLEPLSVAMVTGLRKKKRAYGHQHRRSPFINALSSFFVWRLQPPWSPHANRPSPAPASYVTTEGHLNDVPAPAPSLSVSKPILPSAMMSFHSPQLGGPSSNAPTATTTASGAALSDGGFRHNYPVGSECVVVAVVEPAPSNGGDMHSDVSQPSPHSSLSSSTIVVKANTPMGQCDDNQQVLSPT